MENKQTFGAFIKQRRELKNLSQRDLAKKLFITESAVSKWERGVTYPDITLLTTLSEVLDVSESELIHASENPLQRTMEKDAKKLKNITNTYLYILYSLFGGGVLTSFIVNLAVNHTLSWFFIVLGSVLLASTLLIVPVIVKKHKGLITWSSFYGTLIILLLITRIYVGHGDWIFIALIAITFGLSLIFTPFLLRMMPSYIPVSNYKTVTYFGINTVLLIVTLIIPLAITGGSISTAMLITVVPLVVAWLLMGLWKYVPTTTSLKIATTSLIVAIFQALYQAYINLILEGNFKMEPINILNWDSVYVGGNTNLIVTLAFLITAIVFTISHFVKSNKTLH